MEFPRRQKTGHSWPIKAVLNADIHLTSVRKPGVVSAIQRPLGKNYSAILQLPSDPYPRYGRLSNTQPMCVTCAGWHVSE